MFYAQITDERKDKLIEAALQRYDDSEEVRTSKDGSSIKRVHETYSAIEIAHFCKNVHYKYDIDAMQGVSLGSVCFTSSFQGVSFSNCSSDMVMAFNMQD